MLLVLPHNRVWDHGGLGPETPSAKASLCREGGGLSCGQLSGPQKTIQVLRTRVSVLHECSHMSAACSAPRGAGGKGHTLGRTVTCCGASYSSRINSTKTKAVAGALDY